jgi:hypothetical protein
VTEQPLLVESDLEEYRAGDVDLNLAAATEAVRGYCRWHIAPERTETLTLRAVDGRIVLPTLYATAVSVEIDGTTLEPADYELEPGYLRLTYWASADPVTVTLTHGYDMFPADVKRVILSMADTGTSIGGRLKSAGPFTYEFPDGSEDAAVLDRYRIPSVS